MPFLGPSSPRRRAHVAIVPVAILIALICAVASVSRISGFPPKLERRDFQRVGVVSHVLVDLGRSGITDRHAEWSYFDRINTRADVTAHLMATPPVVARIARRAHIPADQIAADAPVSIEVAGPLTEPGSEMRAREILLARRPYRLEIQSTPGSPIIDIYAEAQSLEEAMKLDDAALAGARDYFAAVAAQRGPLQRTPDLDPSNPVVLRQLGQPRGAVLTAGTSVKVAGLTFLLAFSLAYAALRLLVRRRFGRGRDAREVLDPEAFGVTPGVPAGATLMAAAARRATLLPAVPVLDPGGVVALRQAPPEAQRRRGTRTGDGAWPHTTRVLPWMLAGFMAMLWLVPFDSLQLDIPSPIDLKLDRIVLPFIIGTWVLAMALGGRGAPRVRGTKIHAAVAFFVTIAFLSVILDASTLSQTLELDTSLKKLPLLLSYSSIFVVIASVIRRDEVAAFVKYTLVLAVICALGMVYEDHTFHNVFFDWSEKVLPNVFKVMASSSGWDTEGRRMVHGPTAHPLVAASMLSLAFPIAVLGVVDAKRASRRILYGLAGGILLLGVLNTQRKTGLVAPMASIVTLACFRRRELLRLAPLALVGLVALVIAAPGSVDPVVEQFRPSHLGGANTVSDRASDYDAIRPDVGTHVALGRGYGSYQPVGHRILDSEFLVRLVEMGVLGLAALFLLGGSVVAAARRTIHSRHPTLASPALVGASAGVVFLVLALLFDSLAYPQLPYIFLSVAALTAVIVKSPDDDDG
ncbi:MAG TPA: hypothetical protein VH276_18785 [Solirubrobacteraceae bacterium]|nr:hypothetical protein [Solirubrobacteraceae bacterium]